MLSGVHIHDEKRVAVVGAGPRAVQAIADRGMHAESEPLAFVFNEDDLRLTVRRRSRRGRVLERGYLEFDSVIAAGIRQNGLRLGLRRKREQAAYEQYCMC